MTEQDTRRSVAVHVDNFNEMVFRTEETEPEHFSFTTVALTAGQSAGAQSILSLDPLRKDAAILSIDAPIVLCDSPAQAMSTANQVPGFPAPDGAYIPQGTSVGVTGTGQCWAACQANTRVSIIINRRSA